MSTPRVCFVDGRQQGPIGYLNGEIINAAPDTGSDLQIISTRYARYRRLAIDQSQECQIRVLFADGSEGFTKGLVKNVTWEFGDPGTLHRSDFYVLDNLPCDVILGYEFLEETVAFTKHADCFTESNIEELEARPWFCTITRAPDVVGRLKGFFKKQPRNLEQEARFDASIDLAVARDRLLQVKDDNMERIRELPPEEREQARADFYAWWKADWDAFNAGDGASQAYGNSRHPSAGQAASQ